MTNSTVMPICHVSRPSEADNNQKRWWWPQLWSVCGFIVCGHILNHHRILLKKPTINLLTGVYLCYSCLADFILRVLSVYATGGLLIGSVGYQHPLPVLSLFSARQGVQFSQAHKIREGEGGGSRILDHETSLSRPQTYPFVLIVGF